MQVKDFFTFMFWLFWLAPEGQMLHEAGVAAYKTGVAGGLRAAPTRLQPHQEACNSQVGNDASIQTTSFCFSTKVRLFLIIPLGMHLVSAVLVQVGDESWVKARLVGT